MRRVKDLKHLPNDLAGLIVKGRAEAASEIHYSLQNRSPWFTGTFNTAWQIKGAPVIPSIPRKDIDNPVFTSRKAPKREKPIYTSLVKSVYVGNKADYAGFVINKEKSPYEPNQMYAELFNQTKADGSRFKTTPKPNNPNWYFIYLGGNFLEKDMNKGFQIVGFKPKRNYTMHKGTSA
jgi:hypothetical protein